MLVNPYLIPRSTIYAPQAQQGDMFGALSGLTGLLGLITGDPLFGDIAQGVQYGNQVFSSERPKTAAPEKKEIRREEKKTPEASRTGEPFSSPLDELGSQETEGHTPPDAPDLDALLTFLLLLTMMQQPKTPLPPYWGAR